MGQRPLIKIGNKPILYYVLELALSYPFKKIIINTHYLSEKIRESIIEFKSQWATSLNADIIEIFEQELLDTGGAIKNMADLLGNKPVFTLNSDIIIKPKNPLKESIRVSPNKMGCR
ncbi:MAG: sugar phosphate nucleotidyltransferase [Janthinobacterium lividum]